MIQIDGSPISLQDLADTREATLADGARQKIEAARATIERILDEGRVVYGVNTGFGKLSEVHIPPDQIETLQLNLVRSHACGVGQPLSPDETRAMLILRANALSLGYSGCRPMIVERLLWMAGHDLLPIVPEKGSVGASGDLAPLAHLALGVIGEGECLWHGNRTETKTALAEAGLQPIRLHAKEGLALLNGTQAIQAVGGLALVRAETLVRTADVAGAMSLEALLGTPVAFDERIQAARPHPGQIATAAHLRDLLRGSEIRESHREGDPRVQDAYSLRCMPQVHGAVRGALAHGREVFEIESGSGTDNPLVLGGDVLSGGNFHGAPLAYALDYAAIAITDLMAIAERRIDRLINPDLNEGLPPFLTRHAGSSSGFMIPHVTAVALLNEAKVLAHPAAVDSLPTSGGKEDHVSMGMTSALKFRQIVENAELVFAIEAIVAAEGLDYRKPLSPGIGVKAAHERVRNLIPRLEEDRSLANDIERMAAAIRDKALDL